ncbi:MAG: hypothetical protein ABI347_06915 [Nitrososphaera sp.]
MMFNEIDIIGCACRQLLIDMIESDGIILNHDNWHMLSAIEQSLSKTFGEDAALLLIKRIEMGIDALYRLELSPPLDGQADITLGTPRTS